MWTDETLVAVAGFLRRFHDATAGYVPPRDAKWQLVYPDEHRHELICHNDFAPYNMVFADKKPQALIDFDFAGPGPRIWDIAYAVYRFVPLSWAPDIRALGLTEASMQTRLRLFCDAYGLNNRDELLPMVERRLEALCEILVTGAAEGKPAYRKMVEEGHLAHYRREIEDLRLHRRALEAF